MAYRATEHTENKKAETHARLVKQAKAIVSGEGFRALSIAKVAKQAGIATGTVYRYFPSKSELCIAIFKQATERELEAVQQASEKAGSHREKLTAALSTFIARAQKNPTLAYALIAEPVDPELELARLQYRQTWANNFANLLKKGIRGGEFIKQDSQIIAAALVGAMAEAIIVNAQPKASATILDFCLRAVLKTEVTPS